MPKISRRTVKDVHPDPSGKDIFVWDSGDGSLKGFGIRMKPSGVGSYLVQYRNQEDRTRRLVLGKLTVLAPDEAREMASDKLKAVTKGGRRFRRAPHYTAQMEALQRYRGKGQQKVTVEHVHVHAGGQAIVGNVTHPEGGDGNKNGGTTPCTPN